MSAKLSTQSRASNVFAQKQPVNSPSAPVPSPQQSTSNFVHLSQSAKVGNPRVAVEPLSKGVISPEKARLRQYVSKLDQYSLNGSMALKVPITSRQQDCPTNNGKPWKAYRLPNEKFDEKLKQQWTIKRKDYRGRDTELFCYPDGQFDGEDFAMSADLNNPAVDLTMFTYVPQAEASESLRTLVDLIMPQNAITDVERQRARMTDTIVEFQNNAKSEKLKKDAIDKLAKILGTCEAYAGLSHSRKEVVTKKKAKQYVSVVHSVAIANIGLTEDTTGLCTQVAGEVVSKKIHGMTVLSCVPQSTFQNIQNDSDLVTLHEKNKVKQFLVKYAQEVVSLVEKIRPVNWENAFSRLTSDQKRIL
jgi:hypothetical protein